MTTTPLPPDIFHLLDATLCDGVQGTGARLDVPQRLEALRLLDELGVTFVDAGRPDASDDLADFFEAARGQQLHNARLVAHGQLPAGDDPVTDPGIEALLAAGTSWVLLGAVAHSGKLYRTPDEELAVLAATVAHVVEAARHVFVDAEHFFDGHASDPRFALDVVRVAAEAGAEVVVLCDTTGGMLPSQIGDVVSEAQEIGVDLGIRCHNDTGCAVANTLAAVEAGVVHVQATVNGYGPRAGTTDLAAVVANLQLKYGWPVLAGDQLAHLTDVTRRVATLVGVPTPAHQPYVGELVFEADEEHVDPQLVGNVAC